MAAHNPSALMSMNELIASSVRSRRTVGIIDKLKSTPPLEDERAERFHRLVAEHENAVRRGDDVAAAIADDRLDRLFEEARSAREPGAEAASNVGQSPAEPPVPVPSFDGGVRRPVRRQRPRTLGEAARQEWAAQQAVRERARENRAALDRT